MYHDKLLTPLMFLSQFFIGLTALAFASIMPLIATDLGVTAEHMQFQASLSYGGVFVAQICLMFIVRFLGVKRSYLTGFLLGLIFYVSLVKIHNYTVFMLLLLLSKCGFALAYASPGIVMKKMNYSNREFSSTYGVLMAGFSLGTMLSPPLSAWISVLYSWKIMVGFLCLFGVVIFILLAVMLPSVDLKPMDLPWLSYQKKLLRSRHFIPLMILFNTTSNYLIVINYVFSLLLVQYYQLPIELAAMYLMLANVFVILSNFFVRYLTRYLSVMGIMILAAGIGCLIAILMWIVFFCGLDHPSVAIVAACCFAVVRGLSQPNIVASAMSDIPLPAEIIMPSLLMWSAIPTIITSFFIAKLDDDMISFMVVFLVLLCTHVSALGRHYYLKRK